ncbi:hypothetical protein MLD38_001514 [Melastoma candidum]|uniref:Uncharacterized protein n=1 Tax=Melastoma candidum TaxID=119954 RepID=A0ACB9SF43_9MYRT|nr:hypothetical protein MLD38_001514 [Melastoma candidum]
MASLHVLAIPFPAQGHVIPLMELSQCLAMLGFRVTFVNSEFDHRRVLRSLPGSEGEHIFGGRIRLVSIPDGLEPGEDRNDIARLCQGILKVMPGELERLIGELNERDGEDKVSCVIADFNMSWAFEVAKKMGIQKVAAFWPASAALLAVLSSVPKLIEDGVVDENGTPLKQELIRLDPTMPGMNPLHLSWTCIGNLETQKIVFSFVKSVYTLEDVEWLLCNSSIDLESGTFKYMPRFLPVGPLLASNRLGSTAGSKDGDGFRKRALEMKEKVINGVKEGGKSYQNHSNFVDWLKASKD